MKNFKIVKIFNNLEYNKSTMENKDKLLLNSTELTGILGKMRWKALKGVEEKAWNDYRKNIFGVQFRKFRFSDSVRF